MMWREYFRPTTVTQTLELLAQLGTDARIVSGGTDVLVELQRGIKPTQTLIDVTALDELRYVRAEGGEIIVGGLASHNDVLASPECREHALPLVQACIEVGAPQIRTRGTIAGNMVTASPANDTIVALMALNGVVALRSAEGQRAVPLDEFFTGFRTTVMRQDELLIAIRVRPLQSHQRAVFLKLGLRRAQAISVISVAVVITFDSAGATVARDARIALGCVAPTIVRASGAEAFLRGKVLDEATIAEAGRIAAEEIAPIDDVRGSAAYRRDAVAVYVAEALQRIATDRCADGLASNPVLLDTGERTPGETEFSGTVETIVNGVAMQLQNAKTKTLLNALRDDAGLTGAKEGCAEGECGACTVWLDGQAVMSCLVPAPQAHGKHLTTIEGLGDAERLHPLQRAFIDRGAVQCGFCIPGMLMAGAKLLHERAKPSLAEHQTAISGNLCRCTGYRKILDAMEQASAEMKEHATLKAPARREKVEVRA
jgi:xanthine dehydrogenase iron-sulfur cluster and FAD-binding subunit A